MSNRRMNVKRHMAKVIAMLMCFVIFTTSVDITAFAFTSDGDSDKVIVRIDSLSDEIANQKVKTDATLDDICLPASLDVHVTYQTEKEVVDEDEDTIEPSTEAVSQEESQVESTTDDELTEEEDSNDAQDEESDEEQITEVAGANYDSIVTAYVPMKYYAAEPSENDAAVETLEEADSQAEAKDETITEEVTEDTSVAVTWSVDEENSDKPDFKDLKVGEKYIFVPTITEDGYTLDDDIELPTIEVTVDEKVPVFEKSVTVDGVVITVTADDGVFPDDATIEVRKVTASEENEAAEAIDEVRDDAKNVALSYTFDITVYDKDGNEIEPDTEKGSVKVTFKMAEIANENLETDVYHLEETDGGLNAENLDVNTEDGEEDEAVVETTGFSFYTVEFTYNELQYVLEGDERVELSAILDAVGIKENGEISKVEGSNDKLFKPVFEENVWYIEALKAFSSEEWLKVNIGGVEYEIVVTDAVAGEWSKLQAALGGTILASVDSQFEISDGVIKLLADFTADTGATTLTVNGNRTLDLNGHIINANGKSMSVITVGNGATLNINDSGTDAEHYYKYKTDGPWAWDDNATSGAVEVDAINDSTAAGTSILLKGGAIIGGRGAIPTSGGSKGGGIYNHGTLIMNHGNIVGNSATWTGGGICSDGTFELKGGNIIGNYSQIHGAGVFASGTVVMDDGQIIYNVAGDQAGGVYLASGEFNLNDGAISHNCAQTFAGGVSVSGTMNMYGGEISYNRTTRTDTYGYGGGVHNQKTMNMYGGRISNNSARYGGGIYNGYNDAGYYNPGDLTATGGVVTENNCSIDGGGIYYRNGSITLGKTMEITGNTKNAANQNVYLPSGSTIIIASGDDAPSAGMEIGVSMAAGTGYFTTATATEGCDAYFFADESEKSVVYDSSKKQLQMINGQVQKHDGIVFIAWTETGSLPNTAGNYYLTQDITLSATWNVPSGETNLCLNGYVINGNKGNYSVVTVGNGATLNLYDCDTRSETDRTHVGYIADGLWNLGTGSGTIQNITGGVITGGQAESSYGAGVHICSGGTLNMNGGTIAGCLAQSNSYGCGGGVFVDGGTFIMNGYASIRSCKAYSTDTVGGKGNGAGVYIIGSSSVFTMNDNASICDCVSSMGGGGVRLQGGQFTMNDNAVVSGCSALAGGGVQNIPTGCANNECIFTMNGGVIENNTAYSNESNWGGAGICINNGVNIINNGVIRNNTVNTKLGAGILIYDGTLTIEDCTISGNTGAQDGGGIYIYGGAVTMNGGHIKNNVCKYSGGGIYVLSGGKFYLNDGVIEHNTTSANQYGGGGICNCGTCYLNGGRIQYNVAASNLGGGVCIFTPGVTYINGCTISNNTAAAGGGVHVNTGTLNIGKATKICDNVTGGTVTGNDGAYSLTGGTINNLYIPTGKTVAMGTGDDAPVDGMLIGVTLQSGTGNVTAVSSNTENYVEYFNADNVNYAVVKDTTNKNIKIIDASSYVAVINETGTMYTTVQDAIDAATAGQTIKMIKDSNEDVTVSGNVKLDLNGKVLKGTGSSSVITIGNGATLSVIDSGAGAVHYFIYNSDSAWTLTDSSAGAIDLDSFSRNTATSGNTIVKVTGGCITGGYNSAGGCVYINGKNSVAGTSFSMNGGNIVGNAGHHGGAVYVNGINGTAEFIMSGSSRIIGCRTEGNGCVYVNGNGGSANFAMNNSSAIIGCTTNESGAGIFNYYANTNMNNDSRIVETVSLDTARYGGGVWTNQFFSMTDNASIRNCKAEKGGGVWVDGGKFYMTENSSITGCTAVIDGGGICACNASEFTICDDSKVTGCTAGNGGGGVYSYNCNFIMSGSSLIDGNTANVGYTSKPISGGGVCIERGTFKMTGGTISDNTSAQDGAGLNLYGDNNGITLGGTAKITGNKKGDANNNLYLPNGKTITVATGTDVPATGMKIGVTTQTAPTTAAPVQVSGTNSTDYSSYFISDDPDYSVKTDSNVLKLMRNVATVTTAPQAKTSLKYNASAQSLVTAGVAEHGTMKYALGTDGTTAPTTWGNDIPTGTAVGTYYVWYKSAGDTNYADSTPLCVSVTVAKGTHAVTAPTALNPVYSGEEQALISAGLCTTGTIKYSFDGGDTYTESIDSIKATEIGSYTVYYKVEGDSNYENYGPMQLTAKIVKKSEPAPKPDPTPTPEPDDPDPQPVTPTVRYAETGKPVKNYVVNNSTGSKTPLPYITTDGSKAGWKTIDEALDAHKAKYKKKAVGTLSVTMNGSATVDPKLITDAHEKKIPLSFVLDDEVTVGVPIANTVLSEQVKAGTTPYFNVSSMTTAEAKSVKKAHAGLSPSDITAIGGDENTPVVLILCSNSENNGKKSQLITITFDAAKAGYKKGDMVYLYCGTSVEGIAMYKIGKVDRNGFVTFSVPMVNSYWTIGSVNMKNRLLRKNITMSR